MPPNSCMLKIIRFKAKLWVEGTKEDFPTFNSLFYTTSPKLKTQFLDQALVNEILQDEIKPSQQDDAMIEQVFAIKSQV